MLGDRVVQSIPCMDLFINLSLPYRYKDKTTMSAKEQYKAAYSAIRSRNKALREGLDRFAVNRKHYTVMMQFDIKYCIAADKSLTDRSQQFYGYVCFNWYPDLLNHARYGAYLQPGYASKMIRSYAHFWQE